MCRKILFSLLILILGIGKGMTTPNPCNPEQAKSFVKDLGSRAINTLTNSALSRDELGRQFRSLLGEGFDVNAIGKFSMGRYWRQANSEQQQEFLQLFEKQLESLYAARFKEYKGVKFEILGARVEPDGGVIVSSTLQKPGGPKTKVDWKIYGSTPKIFDVIVEGVSMSISKRDDYASSIQQSGGDIGQFLNTLRSRT